MDTLNLIFIGLSAVATFGLLICTIIGFIFIRKQTKILDSQVELSNKQIEIAKNKDILFSFQNEISNLIYSYHTNYYDLYSKFQNLVCDYNEYGIDPHRQDGIIHSIDNIIYEHQFKPLKSYALSTDFYFWWLGKGNIDKLIKIKQSQQYISLSKYYKPFKSLTNLLNNNKLESKDLKNISDNFVKDYQYVVEEFQNFLNELAKDKGIL